NMSGTSMSTPIVAGLAGLTYSMFPHYTPDSVINRIKNNCDNIDTLNPSHAGQLGSGRINAFKTLDKVIRIRSHAVKDSLQGNGNSRLDYGENVDISITLKNTYQNASDVSITMRSLHPLLTIQDSISALGNLPYGATISNSGSPFSASVGTDSSISMIPILFTITANGNYRYQKVIKFAIGQREILLVNDDETNGSSKIAYYTQALDSLQHPYDVWDIQQQGVPGSGESNYKIVIWYTGEAEQNVLTSAEQQFLQNHLDNQGGLFLTGQNIAYDLVEQQNGIPFFQNYLHASYINNNSNDFALDGIPSDPIGAGETLILLGSGGANNQSSPDIIQAISPAQPGILYDIGNQTDQAALYLASTYKLVYFAFGWEGINDNGQAKRVNVMNRVINWLSDPSTQILDSNSEISKVISLYQNYPNPFNPETTIPFSLSKSEKVSVQIFNNLGQIVKDFPNQKYEAGFHKIIWDGNNQDDKFCSSGIYFYKVTIGEQNFTKKMILIR
ncbi:MAG: S8 family peptidase, partial [bacterium]